MLHIFYTRLISMSIMGMLAILVTLLFKKLLSGKLSPKAHLYIWLPVILRLTIPHMVSSELSIYNYVPNEIARVVDVEFVPQIHHAAENSFHIDYVFVVWLTGFIIALIVPLISYVRFTKTLQGSNNVPRKLQKMCKNAANLCGIHKTPKTIVCENMVSPMIVGFIKPCLVIPSYVIKSFDDEQINVILLHEYTHYKRKDRFVNLFVMLCSAVHWFNPLVWVMSRCLRQDMENVCDEETISVLSAKTRAIYGKTILDLVECAKFRFFNSITSPMACSSNTLKVRIRTLCLYGTKRLKMIILPICIIVSTTLLTGAVADKVDIAAKTISTNIETIADSFLPEVKQSDISDVAAPEYVSESRIDESYYEVPDAPKITQDTYSTTQPDETGISEPIDEIPSIDINYPPYTNTTTETEQNNNYQADENNNDKTPIPNPDDAAADNATAKVYTYTTDGATAQFSSDKSASGFAYSDEGLQIETVGLISSDFEQLHGYFNVYQNGELIGDTVRAYVDADPNNLTFSAVENDELDYSFRVRTRTIE